MGKNSNPAEAHRKAQKKKEKEKNKEARSKNKEIKTVKTDTSEFESEIQKLEEAGKDKPLDKASAARLAELRGEISRVNKTKEDYVKEHPEQRHLVYRSRGPNRDEASTSRPHLDERKDLFGKNGLPKHPKRSIYYDPVLNPYGMPPPGMPYIERPLLPHEMAAEPASAGVGDAENQAAHDFEADDKGESGPPVGHSMNLLPIVEGDVPLPLGLPPGQSDDEDDSNSDDEDIPLPPGPPPGKRQAAPPLPRGPPPPIGYMPTMSYDPSINGFTSVATPISYSAVATHSAPLPPLPMPPHLFQPQLHGFLPPPPPPPGFPTGIAQPMQNLGLAQPQPPHFSGTSSATSSLPPLPPGMPAPPTRNIPSSGPMRYSGPSASAVISAEPELRDFKKESTAFLPNTLKRKKVVENEAAKKPRIARVTVEDVSD